MRIQRKITQFNSVEKWSGQKTCLLMVTQYRRQIYWGKPDKCLYSYNILGVGNSLFYQIKDRNMIPLNNLAWFLHMIKFEGSVK